MHLLLFIPLCLSLCSTVLSAAVTPPCASVYKGFAECLLTLGDSVNTQTDNTQDINSICKSWDAFQVCVSGVLSNCRGDAAEVWESLRAESRKAQFSGNLYDMCASRNQAATPTVPPNPQSTDQTNQESLKGLAPHFGYTYGIQLFSACFSLLFLSHL
ncbi:neuritin 1-like b [Chanos chanos]|uniref:Neuritin 1-like b n=1 Tax=Chanos chanos TaxID=29144 RepID=A0A6J2UPJ9_CHACN|nr:neuritin-like protein [Chanos chanos]